MSGKKKPVIEYRHYTLPVKYPVLLLSGERWHISDIRSEHLHFHNCLEIGICHSDCGTMVIGEEAVSFKAGDITCIPRYLPHTTFSSPQKASLWSYIFFAPEELFKDPGFHADDHLELLLINMNPNRFIFDRDQYPKVHTLTHLVADELSQQKPHYQESTYGLLSSLYIELSRIYSQYEKTDRQQVESGQSDPFAITPVLEYIRQNYMSPLPVGALAGICHVSTTHFRRKFHEIMGAAPLDYINSTRIDEACKLLRSTDQPILTISEQVGFRSISSFNRTFVRLMGETPRAWRKQAYQAQAQSAKAAILEFAGWL